MVHYPSLWYFHWHFITNQYLQSYSEQLQEASLFVILGCSFHPCIQCDFFEYIYPCTLVIRSSWRSVRRYCWLCIDTLHRWSYWWINVEILKRSFCFRHSVLRLHVNYVQQYHRRYYDRRFWWTEVTR